MEQSQKTPSTSRAQDKRHEVQGHLEAQRFSNINVTTASNIPTPTTY